MIALAPADQLCCCFACVAHIEDISREPAFLPTEPMFFTFPMTPDGMPRGRLWSSALKSANTLAW